MLLLQKHLICISSSNKWFVTLIVLLILAGVSIAMLTGDNGVIKQAIEAKKNNREAEAREKLELTLLSAYNEKY